MIGILFDVCPTKEQRDAITVAANKCTFAENALWLEMRRADPMTTKRIIAWKKAKEETGKYPKLKKFRLVRSDGKKVSAYCGTLADGLCSFVYDAVAHHVDLAYSEKRFDLLTSRCSLPVAKKPRLRLRKRGLYFGRDENGRLTARITFITGQWMTLPICLPGRNRRDLDDLKWIDGLIESGDAPSASLIELVKKRGKWKWQLSTSRQRLPGEIAQVNPIPGRVLRVFAPIAQENFLEVSCQTDDTGRDRKETIPGDDLMNWAHVYGKRRRVMQNHWRQSPTNGAHGHGRKRALLGGSKLSDRYEGAKRNWIEQKSHYIAELARKWQCETVSVERLQDRNPALLRAGMFPYFRLIQRIGDKSKERGMKFSEFKALTTTGAELTGEATSE